MNIRIKVDYENNNDFWWSNVQSLDIPLLDLTPESEILLSRFVEGEIDEIVLPQYDAEIIQDAFSEIDGWDDSSSPLYAPAPVLFQEYDDIADLILGDSFDIVNADISTTVRFAEDEWGVHPEITTAIIQHAQKLNERSTIT